MGGEITVKSPPTGANKGSEFTVVLPIKKPAAIRRCTVTHLHKEAYAQKYAALANYSEALPMKNKGRKRPLILLVEDNADVVAYTASCLPDYRLAVGKDGREGFEIAADLFPT